jgi:hypothetical protein
MKEMRNLKGIGVPEQNASLVLGSYDESGSQSRYLVSRTSWLFMCYLLTDGKGHHHPYIACVNYDYRQQSSHFFSPALRHTQLDCDFLERIFDEDHHSHATYINNSVPL